MSIWESLDDLGSTVIGGAGKLIDAITTSVSSDIISEVDEEAQDVHTDTRTVDTPGPTITGFLLDNPMNLVILGVGAVAIYFVVRK